MSMLHFFPTLSKSRVGEQPISRLRTDIDRIFDEFTRGARLPAVFTAAESGTVPSLEVQESEKEVKLSAELPGVDKNDIEVSINEQTITISGEKKQTTEKKEEDYFISERAYGKFSRSLTLPYPVDGDAVQAKYEDGVLTLTIPKPEQPKQSVKRIPVNGA